MTVILRVAVLAGAAALLAATPTFADNPARTPEQNKVQYELQERCGKDAAELFSQQLRENQIASNPERTDINVNKFDYESHYSSKFNDCFALLKMDSVAIQRPYHSLHTEDLWNVNAHRIIGTLALDEGEAGSGGRGLDGNIFNRCDFDGKSCLHEGRTWGELIAPYMKDET